MPATTRIMSKFGAFNLAHGFTQVPNDFFDIADEMDESELRCMLQIIRKINGWHKTRDKISLSQLEVTTGMSRPGVLSGVGKALERGTLNREPSGQAFIYSLNTIYEAEITPDLEADEVTISSLNQPASKPELPVNQANQLTSLTRTGKPALPELVNQPYTQKKYKDTNKERIPAVPADTYTPPNTPIPSTNNLSREEVVLNNREDISPAACLASVTVNASAANTEQNIQTVVTKTTVVEQQITTSSVSSKAASASVGVSATASVSANAAKSETLQKVIAHYQKLFPKRGKNVTNAWLEYWLAQAGSKRLMTAITLSFEKNTNSTSYIAGIIGNLEDEQLSQFDDDGHRVELKASSSGGRRWGSGGGDGRGKVLALPGSNMINDQAREAAKQRANEAAARWGVKTVSSN